MQPEENQNNNQTPQNDQTPIQPATQPSYVQPQQHTQQANTYSPVGPQNNPPSTTYSPQPMATEKSDKSFIGTFLLSWLLGSFGADRFYTGKIGTAILKLITFGGFGIWATIDLILVCFGKFKDKQGRQLEGYEENKGWAKIAGIILAIINILALIVVVGIFLSLIATTTSGIQDKARDSERKTDIMAIHAQIETYKSKNGQYPSFTQINDKTFRAQELPNLNSENFKDPQGTDDQLTTSKLRAYGYSPVGLRGNECNNQTNKCSRYTLQAQLESGGAYVKTEITN